MSNRNRILGIFLVITFVVVSSAAIVPVTPVNQGVPDSPDNPDYFFATLFEGEEITYSYNGIFLGGIYKIHFYDAIENLAGDQWNIVDVYELTEDGWERIDTFALQEGESVPEFSYLPHIWWYLFGAIKVNSDGNSKWPLKYHVYLPALMQP